MTSGRIPLLLTIYRALGFLATPIARYALQRRVAIGKEDSERLDERFGYAKIARQEGTLIWVHAASVGETMSILPLIEALDATGLKILLTTGTVTSAELAASRLPLGARHQFIPVDLPQPVNRFLDHWRPDLAIFCESELWPNLIISAQRRGIAVGIVNGRMSDRTFSRWSRMQKLARAMLTPLAFCLAQTPLDAERYASLGAPARAIGNLKFDVPPLAFDPAEYAKFAAALAGREIFVAASTHPGEEEAILEAASEIRATLPDLITILAPRHPERGNEIAAMAAAGGLILPRRAAGDIPDSDTLVYLADSLGELGLFYKLAALAFVGGTLAPIGGHNPIEPAKLGVPVIHGPETFKNREVFEALDEAGGAIRVETPRDLAREVLRLMKDFDMREALASKARDVIQASEGALETTLVAVTATLAKRQV